MLNTTYQHIISNPETYKNMICATQEEFKKTLVDLCLKVNVQLPIIFLSVALILDFIEDRLKVSFYKENKVIFEGIPIGNQTFFFTTRKDMVIFVGGTKQLLIAATIIFLFMGARIWK